VPSLYADPSLPCDQNGAGVASVQAYGWHPKRLSSMFDLVGRRLGGYEVIAPLGAGGMGEVYRARDSRLHREVALKLLPGGGPGDPARLARFAQEARAASALNHPNIVTVHDVGSEDGTPYLVMELVEGKTLRELMSSPLPLRRLLELASQIAEGVGKAHAAGIVHRDLKPENVMVTRDGLVKVLDFGLAKLASPETGDASGLTTIDATRPGTVLGTVGYMSPEQASAQPADFRSDQFALGSILYELLSGRRAFQRPTAAQTLAAIIQEEPEPLAALAPRTPAPLRWIVERCHAKDPEQRYASTRDLARDLATVRDRLAETTDGTAAVPAPPRRGDWGRAAGAAALLIAAVAATALLTRRAVERPLPRFQRLTFRRGDVSGARFAPDEKTVVYDASVEGRPAEIFTLRLESPESRPLGLPRSELLSVSSSGELAIFQEGTLQRVSLGGGAPRPWLGDVVAADWSPDGKQLAVVKGGRRLEFPPGTVLFRSERVLRMVRVSPSGRRLAVSEDNGAYGDVAFYVLDGQGRQIAASKGWAFGISLAWAGDDELWFSTAEAGFVAKLWRMDLSGRVRQVAGVPGTIDIRDISRSGKVLLTRDTPSSHVAGLFPGDTRERDVSWLDFSHLDDISADGSTVLFNEEGEAGGRSGAVYIRKTDGGAAVRLGEGWGTRLSPDGSWVLARTKFAGGGDLVLLPTGAGETRTLSVAPLTEAQLGAAEWFPDGKRIAFTAAEKGRRARCWTVEVAGGPPRPITPEGIVGYRRHPSVSPDGRALLVTDARDEKATPPPVALFSLEMGALRRLDRWQELDGGARFRSDGTALLGHVHDGDYVALNNPAPVATRLVRYRLADGATETYAQITLPDPAGVWSSPEPLPAADGTHYAYFYGRVLNDLYLAEGLR